MYIIAGLGNPGMRYAGTRHNRGFDVVNALVRSIPAMQDRSDDLSVIKSAVNEGEHIYVVMPQTFMNKSGVALSQFLRSVNGRPDDVVVVYDDVYLPLGTLRLRLKGSDGGHNGMASVIEELGTTEIRRLRCGVRGTTFPSDASLLAQYVLSSFEPDEQVVAREMVVRACDALQCTVRYGFDRAMQEYNVTREVD